MVKEKILELQAILEQLRQENMKLAAENEALREELEKREAIIEQFKEKLATYEQLTGPSLPSAGAPVYGKTASEVRNKLDKDIVIDEIITETALKIALEE